MCRLRTCPAQAIYMCYATLSTGLLRYTRNDSRFFVHVSPADFVLAATFAYRSVSLRASIAQRGNPVYFMLRAAHSYVSPADFVLAASCASLGFIPALAIYVLRNTVNRIASLHSQ